MTTPTLIIKTWPCELCDATRTERETGAGACASHPTDPARCDKWRKVAKLEAQAREVAALVAGEPERDLRRAEALSYTTCFDELLDDHCAQLDCEGFLAACGVHLPVGVRG